jgi:predicted ABC-type ATPase
MTSPAPRPTLFLIAGPNGAGKSTFYHTVVKPRIQAPFINAGIIQRDELKDTSVEAAYEGRTSHRLGAMTVCDRAAVS